MKSTTDFYTILNVKRGATADEIKRAYRKLAKKHHPDRNPNNPNAEARFKDVQRAYAVLGDPEKRSQYDQFGEAGVGRVAPGPGGERVYEWGGNSKINLDDLQDLFGAFGGSSSSRASIFDQMFGGGGRRTTRRPAPQRGRDVERRVSLSLDQVVTGASVTVEVRAGANGRSETLEVKVPAGVDDGQRIRLTGKGQSGSNRGAPGDLFLICSVKPHPYFRREGSDVYVDVPISVVEAALGARIDVPTLAGSATVSVPAGTHSGAKLRLKGRGIVKRAGQGTGDLYVVIKIVPPAELTDQQRGLFEKLQAADSVDPRSQCAWNRATSG